MRRTKWTTLVDVDDVTSWTRAHYSASPQTVADVRLRARRTAVDAPPLAGRHTLLMSLLDILFPKRCVRCGKLGNYFCASCVSTIQPIESNEAICPMCEKPAIDGSTHPKCERRYGVDGLTSFFHYDGVIQKAIKTLKYRYVSDLASEFISLVPDSSLAKPLSSKLLSTFIVPIPLHPSRFRDRGFNQAEKLGSLLASRLNISVNTAILRRTRETQPQVEMKKREDRLKNIEGVFTLHHNFDKKLLKQKNVKISQSHIVLFDDVFTTGATMRAAANVLKRAGVKRVWAVTMAR